MADIVYKGFLPQESDGNAKIKEEFVVIKQRPEEDLKENLTITEKDDNKVPKKVRGQNKNRPRPSKEVLAEKLCPSKVNNTGVCSYGDKCKFIHDVNAYMQVKPKDLGPVCIAFRKRGICQYSFACRFGKDHTSYSETEGYKNVVNERLKEQSTCLTTNILTREMQINLRKRKVDFSRTGNALKLLEQETKKRRLAKHGDSPEEGARAQSKPVPACDKPEAIPEGSNNVADISTNQNHDNVQADVTKETTINQNHDNVQADVTKETTTNENHDNVQVDVTKDATTNQNHDNVQADVTKETTTNENHDSVQADVTKETTTNQNHDSAQADVTKETTTNQESGCVTDEDVILLRDGEKKKIDFVNKLYLAPLTTCGNLPFRVVCKGFGADVTCGEMALSTNLLQGSTSEWALIKRHPREDLFGAQICGAFPDTMSRCAEMLDRNCDVDFIDVNMGCPIDLVYKKGAGSALMRQTNKLFDIVSTMKRVITIPLTCKLRTGIVTGKNNAHNLMTMMRDHGVALATLHGRSREARYTRIADWNYINQCAIAASPMPVFGNGDIFSYHDYYSALENTKVSGIMIARGALIKPWIFTEIKERRDWDISSTERFNMLKEFTDEGLMHWGSDSRGVEITRRFLLEWCSFLHRYIPLGILDRPPQRINERPPYYVGRNDLETLMASPNSNDWVKLSEMLLGPVPDSFIFLPKHRANSYK